MAFHYPLSSQCLVSIIGLFLLNAPIGAYAQDTPPRVPVTVEVAPAATNTTAPVKAEATPTKSETAPVKAEATPAVAGATVPIDVTNSPYRLLVGTNLDFNDKNINLNGLYAKVDVFLADQQNRSNTNPALRRFGFLGSIYLNQAVSGDYFDHDTLSRTLINRTLVRAKSTPTLATVALSSLTAKSVTGVKSLGFAIHPTFRLFSSYDSTNADGTEMNLWKKNVIVGSSAAPERREVRLANPHSTLYVGAHLEVVRRVYSTQFSYGTATAYDTVLIAKTATQPFPYSLPASRPDEVVNVFYERYYGISFPYRYVSNEVDLRFTPSFGLAYLAPSGYTRYMTATLDITERNSGITFGAEIRDYSSLKQPLLGLYISKSFLLTRLGDLLNARS